MVGVGGWVGVGLKIQIRVSGTLPCPQFKDNCLWVWGFLWNSGGGGGNRGRGRLGRGFVSLAYLEC